jgi:hypothetical protein
MYANKAIEKLRRQYRWTLAQMALAAPTLSSQAQTENVANRVETRRY